MRTARKLSRPGSGRVALAYWPGQSATLALWSEGDDQHQRAGIQAQVLGPRTRPVGRQVTVSGPIDTQFTSAEDIAVQAAGSTHGYLAGWTVTPTGQRPVTFTLRGLDPHVRPLGSQQSQAQPRSLNTPSPSSGRRPPTWSSP